MNSHLIGLYSVGLLEVALGTLVAWPIQILLSYIGVVTIIIAFCTQFRIHNVMGKRVNGSHPWWSWILFANWHLLYRLVATYRLHPTDPRKVEIHPGWVISAWPQPKDHPIPCVAIDMAAELPLTIKTISYHSCPTLDRGAPSLEELERLVSFAIRERGRASETVVNCAQGYGRSAMALSAILVQTGDFSTWRDAFAAIQMKRPNARLSKSQIEILDQWSSINRGETCTMS